MRSRSVPYLPETTVHALADPTRLAVLDLLRRGPQPAGQIAASFPISRPAISKHLRQLREARLVVESRSGRHRVYRLNAAPLKAANAWLERYRQFWQMDLGNLKSFVEQEYARESGALSRKRPKKAR
jgi:DNA-binding transcriptional ArsR family regulator